MSITTIIFDLDGVLIDSNNIHYESFNKALFELTGMYVTKHLYDSYTGSTSKSKLQSILTDSELIKNVLLKKEICTIELLENQIKYDYKIYELFEKLSKKYKLCIASNSRKIFVDKILEKLHIKKYVTYTISGDECKFQKPHPEIYINCVLNTYSNPKETIIFEDSYVGLNSAKDSGSNYVKVNNIEDMNYENVIDIINIVEKNKRSIHNQIFDKPNIVVPMAGFGSRFQKAGYTLPKPFIDVLNKPMINVTIDSIGLTGDYIFCILEEHIKNYSKHINALINNNDHIISINSVTQGAACTVLLAEEHIDNDNPLFIINSDQYIEWDSFKFLSEVYTQNLDGGIITFKSNGNKWSYAKVDTNNIVLEVAEKIQISDNATAGIYFWKKGSDYVKYAKRMIEKNIRVNNEFYVCPVYNEAIADGLKFKIFDCKRMLCMGTPEDLENTLKELK